MTATESPETFHDIDHLSRIIPDSFISQGQPCVTVSFCLGFAPPESLAKLKISLFQCLFSTAVQAQSSFTITDSLHSRPWPRRGFYVSSLNVFPSLTIFLPA